MSARAPRLTTSTETPSRSSKRPDHHASRDHADRAGHGRGLRDDLVRADRHHVAAAGGAVGQTRDDRLGLGQALDRVEHAIRRQRAAAAGIDVKHGAADAAIFAGAVERFADRLLGRHRHRPARLGDDRPVHFDHADPRPRQATPGNAPPPQVASGGDQRRAVLAPRFELFFERVRVHDAVGEARGPRRLLPATGRR